MERLARIAVSSDLHLYLRHKAPELQGQFPKFMEGMNEYPIHLNGLLDSSKVLTNVVESVIGAIFLDSSSSLETVWTIFTRLADPLISLDTLGRQPTSELHELCQKNKMTLSFFKDSSGENTTVDVLVDGHLFGSANYSNKEIAQNRADKAALDRLKKKLEETSIS